MPVMNKQDIFRVPDRVCHQVAVSPGCLGWHIHVLCIKGHMSDLIGGEAEPASLPGQCSTPSLFPNSQKAYDLNRLSEHIT